MSNNSDIIKKGVALNKYAKDSNLSKGHIVELQNDKYVMWTGSQFIGVSDMGINEVGAQ